VGTEGAGGPPSGRADRAREEKTGCHVRTSNANRAASELALDGPALLCEKLAEPLAVIALKFDEWGLTTGGGGI
jgi:hypothetical protein